MPYFYWKEKEKDPKQQLFRQFKNAMKRLKIRCFTAIPLSSWQRAIRSIKYYLEEKRKRLIKNSYQLFT